MGCLSWNQQGSDDHGEVEGESLHIKFRYHPLMVLLLLLHSDHDGLNGVDSTATVCMHGMS